MAVGQPAPGERTLRGRRDECAILDRLREGARAERSGVFVVTNRINDFLRVRPEYAQAVELATTSGEVTMLALVGRDRLPRILDRLADEGEFLSRHGIRSLSAAYRGRPFEVWQNGRVAAAVEPAESTTALSGGNSNWRGPVWFPVNFLVMRALERFARRVGDGFTVEFPRGSGTERSLREITHDLAQRLVDIFLVDPARGVRPVFADRVDPDASWRDAILFHEYFDGDTGRGLGASHQTGWTGLVADLVIRLSRAREEARR